MYHGIRNCFGISWKEEGREMERELEKKNGWTGGRIPVLVGMEDIGKVKEGKIDRENKSVGRSRN